jgi:hypothetical protein
MKCFYLVLSSLLGLLLPLPAAAGALAELEVFSRATGERLPVCAHEGKLHIAGQPGERYAVRVTNRTARRILAVVSVDGINVVSGETAAPHQTGYVLDPWQSYAIEGWRKNLQEVAAFYFTALPDSYGARTDRPGHVGVIGVAVFQEWQPPQPRPHPHPRSMEGAAASHDQSAAARAEEPSAPAVESGASTSHESGRSAAERSRRLDKLGTGHGEQRYAAASYTDFRRARAHPNEVLALYYDRYENLLARGIVRGSRHSAVPQPFPGAVRFVPDPPR